MLHLISLHPLSGHSDPQDISITLILINSFQVGEGLDKLAA